MEQGVQFKKNHIKTWTNINKIPDFDNLSSVVDNDKTKKIKSFNKKFMLIN